MYPIYDRAGYVSTGCTDKSCNKSVKKKQCVNFSVFLIFFIPNLKDTKRKIIEVQAFHTEDEIYPYQLQKPCTAFVYWTENREET